MENEENLPGFIFMCNRITKPECYRFRVFGLPAGRKDVVANIRRGTFLFLFDTDVKLLYGIYRADSTGRLNIEPFAFGRKFPAQVKFNIYKDCFPLPENHFKHAIIDNYQRGSNKFNPELSSGQVRNLLELFRPLHVLSTAPPRPVLNEIYSPSTLPLPPMNNVFHQTSRSSFEDSYFSRMSPNQAPRQLNYRHVNELAEPTGWAYPVNKLIPNSAAEHSVISQAPRNQLHAEAVYAVTPEGTYAARTATSYTLSHPQYTQQGILKPQPEFHTQSLHDSQHAHLNVLHPQHDLHPSMMTMHSGYVQSMPDSHHQHHNILNQPADYHSAVANTGSSHAQTVMHSGYVQSMPDPHHQHHNILNQPSDYPSAVANTGSSHAQTVTHSSYVQSMPDPHHQHHNTLNQPADYHSSVANTGSSHAQTVMHSGYIQSMPDPHHQHHNTLNQPADYHSAVANTGSSHAQTVMHSGYVQSMPDPHHQHQNILNQPAAVVNTGSSHAQTVWDPHYNHHYILNQQPDSYSSMANRGSNYAQSLPYPQHTHQEAQKANVVMQSHAQSSSYSPTPHLPQEVVPATRSDQGSGAIQEVISSGQQTGMGSGYYPSSTQTEANVSTQENVVSHLHSANTYSLS